jgi:hypothetical protein
MTQALGPGKIAFSKEKPGEMVAIPLDPGQGPGNTLMATPVLTTRVRRLGGGMVQDF